MPNLLKTDGGSFYPDRDELDDRILLRLERSRETRHLARSHIPRGCNDHEACFAYSTVCIEPPGLHLLR